MLVVHARGHQRGTGIARLEMDHRGDPAQTLAHGKVRDAKHGGVAAIRRAGGFVGTCTVLWDEGAVDRIRLGGPLFHVFLVCDGGGQR